MKALDKVLETEDDLDLCIHLIYSLLKLGRKGSYRLGLPDLYAYQSLLAFKIITKERELCLEEVGRNTIVFCGDYIKRIRHYDGTIVEESLILIAKTLLLLADDTANVLIVGSIEEHMREKVLGIRNLTLVDLGP